MVRACSTYGEKRNVFKILVEKPEERRPLGRHKLGWMGNIKICLRDRMVCYRLDWSGSG
jgi:hypothetical protein